MNPIIMGRYEFLPEFGELNLYTDLKEETEELADYINYYSQQSYPALAAITANSSTDKEFVSIDFDGLQDMAEMPHPVFSQKIYVVYDEKLVIRGIASCVYNILDIITAGLAADYAIDGRVRKEFYHKIEKHTASDGWDICNLNLIDNHGLKELYYKKDNLMPPDWFIVDYHINQPYMRGENSG